MAPKMGGEEIESYSGYPREMGNGYLWGRYPLLAGGANEVSNDTGKK